MVLVPLDSKRLSWFPVGVNKGDGFEVLDGVDSVVIAEG